MSLGLFVDSSIRPSLFCERLMGALTLEVAEHPSNSVCSTTHHTGTITSPLARSLLRHLQEWSIMPRTSKAVGFLLY
jgi:hypothetical protein